MYLTSLTHRDMLFDISQNWLHGNVDPGDGAFITAAFLLEHAITAPSVTGLLEWTFASHLPGELRFRHVRTKEQVRRSIIRGWTSPTPRARGLFEEFERLPEAFFPTTPVDTIVAIAPDDGLVGMVRFKSLFRIADKVARGAARRLRADVESILLAGTHGGALSDLASVPGFAAALQEVNQTFLNGRARLSRDDLRVDDAIGAKLILPEEDMEAFEHRLASHPNVLSVQHREHHGPYNDVHLLAEVRCPPGGRTIDSLRAMDWRASAGRGVSAQQLRDAVPQYVETGAKTFFLEVLLTTLPELVESEFGRGLHEERIARQRLDPLWSSRVATNVQLTTLSMLLLALAPTITIEEPPGKMSGRYLPETALGLLAQLFGLGVARSPFWVPEAIPDISCHGPDAA